MIESSVFLCLAQEILKERAKEYESPKGEKSMEQITHLFNTLFNKDLTPTQGYVFMVLLKLVRATKRGFKEDTYIDAINYIALAGEEASK